MHVSPSKIRLFAEIFENYDEASQLRLVDGGESASWQTPIKALNHFMAGLKLEGVLSEWGVAQGSLARLLPLVLLQSLEKSAVWLTDHHSHFYPPAWRNLGFDLGQSYFLKSDEALESARTLLREGGFPVVILDLKAYLEKPDLHFFSRMAEKQGTTVFLLRSFYLSSKNGNPYARHRFNSFYSLKNNSFSLSTVKGNQCRRLHLPFQEVLS